MGRGRNGGMEWWSNGELEYWSNGVMGWWGLTVGDVALFYDQAVNPIACFLFPLQALDEFQETVFEFEGQGVQGVEVGFCELFSFAVSLQAGSRFSEGAETDVQMIEILAEGTAAIALGDVAVHRVRGGNSL
jgi:hypothetical protein